MLCVRSTSRAPAIGPLQSLWLFWVASGALWLGLTLLAWRLWRQRRDDGPPHAAPLASVSSTIGDTARGRAAAVFTVLIVAGAARVVIVFGTAPQLSDDLYRYVFDGRTLVRGDNPYAAAPADARVDHPADAALVKQINNPKLVTIYLPASQYVFALLAVAAGDSFDTTACRAFRLGFIALDLLIVAMLLRRLRIEGRSPWWAALYAWHPLALSEIAGSGHQDVLGIAALLAALMLTDSVRPGSKCEGRALTSRVGLAGSAFAVALAVKPIVLPLALPLAWGLRDRPRLVVLGGGAVVLMTVALTAPLALMDGSLGGLFETVRTYVSIWSHNESLHALLAQAIGWSWASYLCAAALGAVVLAAVAGRCDQWHTSTLYLFALVLLWRPAHPWYLLWAAALLPLRFNAALWVFTLTIGWSYAVLCEPGNWELPAWVRVVEYAPVYGLIGVFACRRAMGRWRRRM